MLSRAGCVGAGRPKNLVAGVQDPARALSSVAGGDTGEYRARRDQILHSAPSVTGWIATALRSE
jgi:hypothetical protein